MSRRSLQSAVLALALLAGGAAQAGALGANYNEHVEDIDYRELESAKARWIRAFLTMPELDQTPAAEHPMVVRFLDARQKGYHTVFSLKWPFPRSDFPAPGTPEFEREVARLDQLLPVIMGKVDILVIGNEPYIESREADRDLDLNRFYEAMAERVIAYRAAHCANDCPTRLYMGALNRMDLKKNHTASTERWLEYVRSTPQISGVDIHPHVPSLQASKPFVDYVVPRLRADQKFIVTEFSLVHWWRQHLEDPIPAAFAAQRGLPAETKVWEYIKAAIANPVPKAEWDAFLSQSPWFESRKHYLVNQMALFERTGRLDVATYGFKQGSSMARNNFGPQSTPWLLNSVFAARVVRPGTDGMSPNYAWIDDFRALQKPAQPR